MTDRELTALAAKAYGDTPPGFSPLTDDGDALRLVVKLKLCVDVGGREIEVMWNDQNGETFSIKVPGEKSGADPAFATRRAIVMAAAALATPSEERS